MVTKRLKLAIWRPFFYIAYPPTVADANVVADARGCCPFPLPLALAVPLWHSRLAAGGSQSRRLFIMRQTRGTPPYPLLCCNVPLLLPSPSGLDEIRIDERHLTFARDNEQRRAAHLANKALNLQRNYMGRFGEYCHGINMELGLMGSVLNNYNYEGGCYETAELLEQDRKLV